MLYTRQGASRDAQGLGDTGGVLLPAASSSSSCWILGKTTQPTRCSQGLPWSVWVISSGCRRGVLAVCWSQCTRSKEDPVTLAPWVPQALWSHPAVLGAALFSLDMSSPEFRLLFETHKLYMICLHRGRRGSLALHPLHLFLNITWSHFGQIHPLLELELPK